ncbi:MAG: DUF2306 domain-containing protein [Gammaproteobacteria bacterium]
MLRIIGWGMMVLLASLVGIYALSSAFVPSLRTEFVANLFLDNNLRAFGHLAAGGIAIVTGACQFSARLRQNSPVIHRALGRIYVVMVLASGISAGFMAPFSDGGVAAHFGFGMMAFLWLATTVMAYLRIRSRDFSAHREWMIRSYALCLAAVTLRIYLPLSAVAGIPFSESYPAISWLCWVPNLIIAEWFLVRGSIAPLPARR